MHCITAAAPPSSLASPWAYSANDLIIFIMAMINAPKAREPMLVTDAHLKPSMISPDPSFSALEVK